MKALVTAANKFAGERLPFHGRGGKIDRMIVKTAGSKAWRSNENNSLSRLYHSQQGGGPAWVRGSTRDEEDHIYDQDSWDEEEDEEEYDAYLQYECEEPNVAEELERMRSWSAIVEPFNAFGFSAVATISKLLVGRVIGKGGSRIQELRSVEGMTRVELTDMHELKLFAISEEALRQGMDMAQEFVGVPVSFKVTRPRAPETTAPTSFANNIFNDPPLPSKK